MSFGEDPKSSVPSVDCREDLDGLSVGLANTRFALLTRWCFTCEESCGADFPSSLGLEFGDRFSLSATEIAVRYQYKLHQSFGI